MPRPIRENFGMFFANYHSPEETKRLTDEAFARLVKEYDSAPDCIRCGGRMVSFVGPSTPHPMRCEDCGRRL